MMSDNKYMNNWKNLWDFSCFHSKYASGIKLSQNPNLSSLPAINFDTDS